MAHHCAIRTILPIPKLQASPKLLQHIQQMGKNKRKKTSLKIVHHSTIHNHSVLLWVKIIQREVTLDLLVLRYMELRFLRYGWVLLRSDKKTRHITASYVDGSFNSTLQHSRVESEPLPFGNEGPVKIRQGLSFRNELLPQSPDFFLFCQLQKADIFLTDSR